MIPHRGYRPVVVGIDGSGGALDALDWAAAEAAVRGLPLCVLHACSPPVPADPFGALAGPVDDRAFRDAADAVLAGAVSRARSVAPDGRVTSRLVIGPPAQAILEHAPGAELAVVGSGRSGPLRGLLGRSVAAHLVAHAPCPVAVVPPFHEVPPGPSAARVVVGIGAADRCADAVGFAFQAAEQRGTALTAVHAWLPRGPADPEGACDDVAAGEKAGQRVLADALEPWTEKYPHVPVEPRLVRGDPVRSLVAESAGAALTVVGTRGRGGLRGVLPGSPSRLLLHHAHCPVAVLRAPA